MNRVIFDFSSIESIDDFYSQFAETFELPDYFGDNLDALWDVITAGEIPLPITIEFVDLPMTDEYDSLINLFEQAEEEMDGDLTFIYPQDGELADLDEDDINDGRIDEEEMG